ncbi:hypothetical protein D3P06_16620 [Paracoccus aestuarii]|uniref:Uncharacterized protein n=1 Tax=Paracoccus aestuarii TaxID=453842 RepID=A0A418ZR01_9RHOB|nr:hypothetical protein D3P06_16620 [Paracoccus aestuarii]
MPPRCGPGPRRGAGRSSPRCRRRPRAGSAGQASQDGRKDGRTWGFCLLVRSGSLSRKGYQPAAPGASAAPRARACGQAPA